MPGAPNRPPENKPAPPPASAVAIPPQKKVLRRLAPSRVTLSLDIWRGAPSSDLVAPLERAEVAYAAGDWREADSQLDGLAVRLHEPRWPTIPEPFRSLRVAIPFPQPPQWNPELQMTPADREAIHARKTAELQLALARSSVEFARAKNLETSDLDAPIERAAAALAGPGVDPAFYESIDPIWEAVRARVPMPKPPAARAPPPVATPPPPEGA
ncbi:MAG: hypothetical protein WAN74_06680 [Thermoplasmata archaeon]